MCLLAVIGAFPVPPSFPSVGRGFQWSAVPRFGVPVFTAICGFECCV